MVDVKCLRDCELQNRLENLGFSPGPMLQLNIILKGNITVSTEKSKEPKKRPKAFTTNPKALDVYCPNYKAFKKIRCAARAASIRIKGGTITKGKDCCVVNWNVESRGQEVFPVGLKLAVLGIFIIVVFVYITVEKKPLFG
ncbi:LEM domain-containing protein 1 isoform X2 [Cynocephalus volans]|uniref:LEM domain-containing protein 1 isoform X2 n=1 Tax=Cynocephalus volans TaxID=110931 RepID=UPI002FCC0E6A